MLVFRWKIIRTQYIYCGLILLTVRMQTRFVSRRYLELQIWNLLKRWYLLKRRIRIPKIKMSDSNVKCCYVCGNSHLLSLVYQSTEMFLQLGLTNDKIMKICIRQLYSVLPISLLPQASLNWIFCMEGFSVLHVWYRILSMREEKFGAISCKSIPLICNINLTICLFDVLICLC